MLLSWSIFWAYWLFAAWSAERTVQREALATRVPHLVLVTLGFFFIFFPVAHLDTRFLPRWLNLFGLGVLGVGLGLAVWARRHLGRYWSSAIALTEGQQIVRTGPYRLVRHPIYTGFLVAVLGSAFILGNTRGLLALLCVSVAYAIKIPHEERFLLNQFGDEYRRYQSEVKAVIPFVA